MRNSLTNKLKIILFGVLVFVIGGILIFYLWYSNDAYQNTPLEALEFSKNNPTVDVGDYSEEDLYSIVTLKEVVIIEKYAYVIYISNVDMFTIATCEFDQFRNKWIHIGIAYEENLDNPQYLIWTNNNNMLKGGREGNIVLGLKFKDETIPYIQEKRAEIKTYDVNLKNKNYQIEFWWIENIYNDDYEILFK